MSRRRERGAAAVVALCALLVPLLLGAAPSGVRPALCIPLIWCPQPSPTPTPAPTPLPTTGPQPDDDGRGDTAPEETGDAPAQPDDGGLAVDPAPEDDALPGDATETPAPAEPDEEAPIFTATPAQMSAKGLSFSGLKGVALVTVPTMDGERIRVLKISADSITITGFALSVRPPGGPGLVTDADTMSLRGHVSVYLGSLTATTKDGRSLTLGQETPPSLDDVEPGLLDVHLGLVGTTADSIAYTDTDQRIVAAG